jgi:hypothetical protein
MLSDRFRAAAEQRNVDQVPELFHEDAAFVLEDPADRVAILEFATEVDGKQVEGIDKLTFDEDGLITELTVMIRPASALQVVAAGMAAEFPRVGLTLPS